MISIYQVPTLEAKKEAPVMAVIKPASAPFNI